MAQNARAIHLKLVLMVVSTWKHLLNALCMRHRLKTRRGKKRKYKFSNQNNVKLNSY